MRFSPQAQEAIYVYEMPVRIWHWVNATAIIILMVTGYLIAKPLPTMPGEASDHFLMGYIRFTHFAAAYIFAIGFLARLYWAWWGNHHARQLFKLPILRKNFVFNTVFMIVTGFALYSEGEGKGGWTDTLFGWVIPMMGQSQDVHTWHHLGMWVMVLFMMTHIYVAIREDIMSRQSLISTMISGWRMFKDNRP